MESGDTGEIIGTTTGDQIVDIEVVRDDLARVRVRRTPRPQLAPGEVRLRVDTFALTANNITYAVYGEGLRYWDVFPAGPPVGDAAVWGRVPVWGFADVIESTSPEVAIGERLYGYLPMSNELVIVPGRADSRGLTDIAAHRAGLAGAYNRYVRCATDPMYRPDRERMQMVMYPLFATSFMIDDQLGDHRDAGEPLAGVVISSASSKTSIGVAFGAHQRGVRVIGLTSAANAEFTRSLGVYDEVVTYDELLGDAAGGPGPFAHLAGGVAFVDVAGNADVRRAVHTALTERLTLSLTVGGTHWDHRPDAPTEFPLPGPEPTFFFAPTRIAERTRDWGRQGFDTRIGEAWGRFTDWATGWVEMRPARGVDEVTGVYLDLLAGRVDPRHGHVCTLHDSGRSGAGDAGAGDADADDAAEGGLQMEGSR